MKHYQPNRSSTSPRTLFRENPWVILTYGLFAAYLLLIIVTFLDYGITYDEEWYATYGNYIVEWYLSAFQDNRALTYWTLPLQGGVISVIDQLFSRISPWSVYETSHLVHGLLGFLGIYGASKVGRMLNGPQAGFFSALFLFLTPRYYGHVFNNTIDISFASLSIIALYLLLASISHLPKVPWKELIKLGIIVGLALAVRTAAVVLVGYVAVTYVLWMIRRYMTRSADGEAGWRKVALRLAYNFFAICGIAYLIMLLFWPAAQVRPIVQPAKGLLYSTRFQYTFDVFFEGQSLANNELPWYFLPKWFAIALPEFYFIALSVGIILIVLSVTNLISSKRAKLSDNHIGITTLILSIVFPLTLVVITRPANYDGLRHFLFILPPLAALAGASIARVIQRPPSRVLYGVILAGVLVSIALTSFDMWQLHPYQYIYFNRLVGGGVSKASQYYETDYWGSSYKEGVEWLVKNYQAPAGQGRPKVASCLYSLSTSYYLPEDRFEYIGTFHDGIHIESNANPDIFLASPRWDCQENLDGEIIHSITRQGASLLYIIEVSRD